MVWRYNSPIPTSVVSQEAPNFFPRQKSSNTAERDAGKLMEGVWVSLHVGWFHICVHLDDFTFAFTSREQANTSCKTNACWLQLPSGCFVTTKLFPLSTSSWATVGKMTGTQIQRSAVCFVNKIWRGFQSNFHCTLCVPPGRRSSFMFPALRTRYRPEMWPQPELPLTVLQVRISQSTLDGTEGDVWSNTPSLSLPNYALGESTHRLVCSLAVLSDTHWFADNWRWFSVTIQCGESVSWAVRTHCNKKVCIQVEAPTPVTTRHGAASWDGNTTRQGEWLHCRQWWCPSGHTDQQIPCLGQTQTPPPVGPQEHSRTLYHFQRKKDKFLSTTDALNFSWAAYGE